MWARFRTVKLGWTGGGGGTLQCYYSDAFSIQPSLRFLIKWFFDRLTVIVKSIITLLKTKRQRNIVIFLSQRPV
jgi:hypothetical protein